MCRHFSVAWFTTRWHEVNWTKSHAARSWKNTHHTKHTHDSMFFKYTLCVTLCCLCWTSCLNQPIMMLYMPGTGAADATARASLSVQHTIRDKQAYGWPVSHWQHVPWNCHLNEIQEEQSQYGSRELEDLWTSGLEEWCFSGIRTFHRALARSLLSWPIWAAAVNDLILGLATWVDLSFFLDENPRNSGVFCTPCC